MSTETKTSAEAPVDKEFLAAHLGDTLRTVDNWMDWLPHWKIGRLVRFDLNQVKKALNERCGRNL